MIHNAEWIECKVCGRIFGHKEYEVCVGKNERKYVRVMPCPVEHNRFRAPLLKALKEAVAICKSAAMMSIVYNEWEKIIRQAEEFSSSEHTV